MPAPGGTRIRREPLRCVLSAVSLCKMEKSRRVLHPAASKVRSWKSSAQPCAYRRYLVCGHACAL